MTAKIDATSFTRAGRALSESSARLQKELVRTYHEAAPEIEADMHQRASTRIQQTAASTTNVTRISDGMVIHGGGGGGLGGVLFAGGEFGGGKSKKVTYATRSPRGRAYIIVRRTTMQFGRHTGRVGHFYFPTLRDRLPKLLDEQRAKIARALGGR